MQVQRVPVEDATKVLPKVVAATKDRTHINIEIVLSKGVLALCGPLCGCRKFGRT